MKAVESSFLLCCGSASGLEAPRLVAALTLVVLTREVRFNYKASKARPSVREFLYGLQAREGCAGAPPKTVYGEG